MPLVPPGVRRWFPLGVVLLAVGVSTAITYPFLALFLDTEVHAGPVRTTIFLVAAPLSSVLVSYAVGRLSDRYPIRRPLLIAVSVAGVVGAGVTAVVRDWWVLLGLTVTAVALAGALLPQAFAYAREVVDGSERAAMTISTLRTLFSGAWVAGPPLAAFLLQTGGFTLMYATAAGTYALAAAVALLWLTAPGAAREAAGDPAPAPLADRVDAPRATVLLTAAAFVLLMCAGNLGVQAMSVFIQRDLGGRVSDVGLILGLCAALEIPLILGFGLLSARVPLRRLMLIGPLCSLAYLAFAASATHPWQLYAGQLLNACNIAVVQGLGISYMQDLLPRHPGRASTLFSNAFPAGSMLAGPILGAAQHFGYRSAYWSGVVLSAAGLALFLAARQPAARATTSTAATVSAP